MDYSTIEAQLASAYQINTTKPFYPVNTMRLAYLMIVHQNTGGSPSALKLTNDLIPHISTTIDHYHDVLTTDEPLSTKLILDNFSDDVKELLKPINTPSLHHSLDMFFFELLPLQHSLLPTLTTMSQQDILTLDNIKTVLHIRAIDSHLYASIIHEIVDETQSLTGDNHYDPNTLYLLINRLLQLNDLVEAVCHIEEDMEAGSATLIDLLKKVDPSPQAIQDNIVQLVADFQTQITALVEKPEESLAVAFAKRLETALTTPHQQSAPAQT